jgi:hypothetical protein
MPVACSFFLVLGLVLAVMIGPQTRPWSWGPAMLALAASMAAALPSFTRRGKIPADASLLAMAMACTAWFAWRAATSPVAELGHADLLLLGAAVAGFVGMRAIAGHPAAERVLVTGLALLLAASVWVGARQVIDPSFSPLFGKRATEDTVTGFAAHYNEAANYFIALSMLAGAAALLGRHTATARLLLGLLALAGLAGVYFTKSRGGILGATTGCAVLVMMSMMIARRRDSRWFAPSLVALPVLAIALVAFWIYGWQQRSGGDTARLLDNDIRFYLLGAAISCIGLHPLTGGGSQSFSWESFQFFDHEVRRIGKARPGHVHNELVQAATDYGLAGAFLLCVLLAALVIGAVLRGAFEKRPPGPDSRDAWRAGGMAALAGMFVQSCFSFVFHTIPGVILLGIGMGMVSWTDARHAGSRAIFPRIIQAGCALACIVILLPAGWKGSRVTATLWSTWLGKNTDASADARIEAVSEAIRIWPQTEFLDRRALILNKQALAAADGPAFTETALRAIEDFRAAAVLHPMEPSFQINQGNLLSMLGKNTEAEECFARGIRLQGGMESAFRGRFSLANHHLRMSMRHFMAKDPASAQASLETAASEIETAVSQMHWIPADIRRPRAIIHEWLGAAREANGDPAGALASYDFASSIPQGRSAHYRAGMLIAKSALEALSRNRTAEALELFTEARRRVSIAGKDLPAGITPERRIQYISYLNRLIATLKKQLPQAEE